MNFRVSKWLFVVAAVLGAVAVFATGFFVVLGVRSVVAGPDSAPAASAPNPGHSWSEIEGHGIDGGSGAYWLGPIVDQALELQVNGDRALRLEPDAESPNVIGGVTWNTVAAGVHGATIGGGGADGYRNQVTDDYGVVGGGRINLAGNDEGTTDDTPYATVGGGLLNWANGHSATVSGGTSNVAGDSGTVGGGLQQ